MTVEERTRILIEDWNLDGGHGSFRAMLADAMRAAIVEEREACALLVESCIAYGDPDGVRFDVPNHRCSAYGCGDTAHIAAAIRARGEAAARSEAEGAP